MSTDDVARPDHAPLSEEGSADAADWAPQQEREWADALALSWRELHRLRALLAERSAQLAETQSEMFLLRRDTDASSALRGRISTIESELNALRYRLHQSETTLARFRGSFSWNVTKPLRWIGRKVKFFRLEKK